jgi:choline dehydrogenase-like flavoprotein
VARILIVGGGCPGRSLARRLTEGGHAVRITTRGESARGAIEATGAECWIGTPDRLATLRGALDHVTIACWMLAGARGAAGQLSALHSSRLELFLTQAIDTTVRGFVYDAIAPGDDRGLEEDRGGDGVTPEQLAGGARIVARLTALNAIPVAVLSADGRTGSEARSAWVDRAGAAIDELLSGRVPRPVEPV